MAESKKHHYVSEFVLRAFANSKYQLMVQSVGSGHEFETSTRKVGLRNNAHTLDSIRGATDVRNIENVMAKLESQAAATIADMSLRTTSVVEQDEKEILQRFIILHLMRHPVLADGAGREVASDLGRFGEHEALARTLLRNVLIESMGLAALTVDAEYDYVGSQQRWATYEQELAEFVWTVQRYSQPSLLVGDRLVCFSGQGPRSTRALSRAAADHGVEGLGTCQRVTIPLTPTMGLLLSRGGALNHLRAANFNRTSVRNSRTFIAFAPEWPEQAPEIYLASQVDFAAQVMSLKRLAAAGLI